MESRKIGLGGSREKYLSKLMIVIYFLPLIVILPLVVFVLAEFTTFHFPLETQIIQFHQLLVNEITSYQTNISILGEYPWSVYVFLSAVFLYVVTGTVLVGSEFVSSIAEKDRYLVVLALLTFACFIVLAVFTYFVELTQTIFSQNLLLLVVSILLPIAIPLVSLIAPYKYSGFRMITEWGKRVREIDSLSKTYSEVKNNSDKLLSEFDETNTKKMGKLQKKVVSSITNLDAKIEKTFDLLTSTRNWHNLRDTRIFSKEIRQDLTELKLVTILLDTYGIWERLKEIGEFIDVKDEISSAKTLVTDVDGLRGGRH